MHFEAMAELLRDQDGVVSRQQILGLGGTPGDLERFLRRRDLTRLAPGVFLRHTGDPSWQQRAWGAVLGYWPAALAGHSALRLIEGPGSRRDEETIAVVVSGGRRLTARPDVILTRRRQLDELVRWDQAPPRLRYEEAVLDLADAADSRLNALDEVARAVQGRRTTARRLGEALERRGRHGYREWLVGVLGDVDAGVSSVLEEGICDSSSAHTVCLGPGARCGTGWAAGSSTATWSTTSG